MQWVVLEKNVNMSYKENGKCTYNVIMRPFHEIIFAVEKQFYIFLCARECRSVSGRVGERVELLIQHSKRMCGLSGSTIFFYIIS